MNANQIVIGYEYAYVTYPRRNASYYPNAHRVRVLHIYKLDPDNSGLWTWETPRVKKQTLVECVRLDDATGEQLDNPIITTGARNIVATWDEHLVEKARYDEEQRLRQQRWEKEEEERRKRIAEREKQRQLMEQQRMARLDRVKEHVAERLGLNPTTVSVTQYTVTIRFEKVEEVMAQNDGTRSETDQGIASV